MPSQEAPTVNANRPPPQDLDPRLAERLAQLRHALGLSVADMAQRLGLWGANGADNLRQMERCARPVPGTLQVLLGYMERELQQQQR
jgi:transcriptional regulator with XRE-family HTH domain